MAGPTYKFIKVADLIPTPDNPRIVRTDSELFRTLADSVKGDGVRIPVIARPHPKKKGKFDLIAGARRLAAAKLAKLKVIPALVYEDMSDEAAFDLTFLENFAREDLTVLEEAQAVAMLLEKNGGDVKAVADKFDKSEKWVRLRANVHGNLSDNWIDEFVNPEKATGNYGIGHMSIIARFDKDTQDQILDEIAKIDFTVAELEAACGELLMDLSKATWDIEWILERAGSGTNDELAACKDCPKRTGYQPLLWDDDPKTTGADRCLDPQCWREHIDREMDNRLAAAKKKHPGIKVMTTDYDHHANRMAAARYGSLKVWDDFKQAKKGDRGSIPFFVVVGKQAGKVVWKKKVAGRSGSSSSSVKGPKLIEEKRKELKSQRWFSIIKIIQPMVEEAPLESIQHEDKLLAVMAIIAHIGFDSDNFRKWDKFSEAMSKHRDFVLVQLWPGIRETLGNDLNYFGGAAKLGDDAIENARQIIKLLGFDQDKLWADAVAACPEPASWAKGKTKKVATPKKKAKTKKAKKQEPAACG